MARRKDRCVGPLFFLFRILVRKGGMGDLPTGGVCFRAR